MSPSRIEPPAQGGAGEKTKRDGAEIIRRSFGLINVLSTAPPTGLTLRDIAARSGLTPPTARSMLKVLVGLGAVEQSVATRRYLIGSQLAQWARARPKHLQLLDASKPSLERAVGSLGIASTLSQRSAFDATCMAFISDRLDPSILLGHRRPLGGPASSLAMLSAMPEDEAN